MTDRTGFAVNTFMIGAQKSGTTYLASLLDQHADICVSNPKEPHYFTHNFERGAEYYRSCFSDPGAKVRIDASTTYSFLRPQRDFDVPGAPGVLAPVPDRIRSHCPEARFIYILRDPVKRAASAYRHNARAKAVPQAPVSLLECMERDPMLVLAGRYGDQIERYFEVFDRDRFLFLDFRELTRDPMGTVAQTCAFLGLSAEGIALREDTGEKHGAFQLTLPGRALRRARRMFPRLVRGARGWIPAPLRSSVAQSVLKVPSQISFSDEAEAAEPFAEDREKVAALTGLRI